MRQPGLIRQQREQWRMRRALRGYDFWRVSSIRRRMLRQARQNDNAAETVAALRGVESNYRDWELRRDEPR